MDPPADGGFRVKARSATARRERAKAIAEAVQDTTEEFPLYHKAQPRNGVGCDVMWGDSMVPFSTEGQVG